MRGTGLDLETISGAVVRRVPVRSIVLCGSRATGQARHDSDYDIIAVMGLLSAITGYSQLKRIERELTSALGVGVSINPLTPLGMRRAKGSLFLYKVKHEGRTIYGPDLLRDLDCGEPQDVTPDRRASFLFSSLRTLVASARPGLASGSWLEGAEARDVAKALTGCGEISLLAHGQYETAPARIAERLSAMGGTSCPEALSGLAEDVALAAEVLGRSSPRMEAGGWFRARDYAAALFSQVAGEDVTQPGRDAIEAGASYAPSRAGLAKNLEFAALVLLSQRRLAWRSVLSLRRVDRALRVALLYLSLALGSAGSVRRDLVDRARRLSKRYVRAPHPAADAGAQWLAMRDALLERWPYSETVMGLA